MNFNKAVIVAILVFIGKASASCAHASKDGYPCCKSCTVAYTDNSGKWGYENDDWCGIDTSW